MLMLQVYPNELEAQPEFEGFSEWLETFDLYRGKAEEETEDQNRSTKKTKKNKRQNRNKKRRLTCIGGRQRRKPRIRTGAKKDKKTEWQQNKKDKKTANIKNTNKYI